MACNSINPYMGKSCVRYYNNATQALGAGATLQLAIAGSRVVDTGTAIEVEPSNYTTLKTGLYSLSADVIVEGTTAGDAILQVYMDGVALPCTTRRVSLVDGYYEIHTETDLYLTGCCPCVSHSFTFTLTSVSTAVGNVVTFCSGILKEA